ncbi:MAG: guanylate kinase [Planctomycetota bacterium]
MTERGRMLVVSGPSGSGKSTICKRLLEDRRVEFSVSATTRAPRAGEVDGRDYWFVDKERFRAMIEGGEFIEWAEVHGNLYGTPRAPMEHALAAGRHFLLEIDVQGGAQLKALGLPGLYVFVAPPDLASLRARLEQRGTDKPEVIERRMAKAAEEMRAMERYDHVVVNRELEAAVAEVRTLVGLGKTARSSR